MNAPASWEVRFEEPDTVFMWIAGTLTDHATNAMIDDLAPVHRTRRVRFHIVDISRLDGMDRAARRVGVARIHEVRPEVTLFYGASSTVRAGFNLLLGAAKLLGRLDYQSKFLATEVEARAWIEARRR